MARFYLRRTQKIVDIPEALTAEYERRKGWTRLPEQPPSEYCGVAWGDEHACVRPPGHDGRHTCNCGSWAKPS